MKVGGLVIILVLIFSTIISADVISINSGGGKGIIISPGANLEGFFFKFNVGPSTPSPLLSSLNGRNESDTNLNCSFIVEDPDSPTLNASVKWYKDSISQFVVGHDYLPNGTIVNSILESGNLTLGDIWKCSVQISDLYNSTQWTDSNNLQVIDITPPNVSIISPNSTNYTTLAIDFNVSISENENVSSCLYSLDSNSNVTMNRFNDSYFWYEPSLGPGPHELTYYCNDTSNNWGTNSTNFTIWPMRCGRCACPWVCAAMPGPFGESSMARRAAGWRRPSAPAGSRWHCGRAWKDPGSRRNGISENRPGTPTNWRPPEWN